MSCFVKNPEDWDVTVPSAMTCDGVTYYKVKIRVGHVSWEVERRYQAFHELHSSLVSHHNVPRDILPPKRMIGNSDPIFIETRRVALGEYLVYIMKYLQMTMPLELSTFLELDLYDIMFILPKMMKIIQNQVSCSDPCVFSIMDVHAVTERLKLPCPPLEMHGSQHDFSAILEFCGQLKALKVHGSKDVIGKSNIGIHALPFDLTAFKSVEKLFLQDLFVGNLKKADDLRLKVQSLSVQKCEISFLSDILLCDTVHKDMNDLQDDKKWPHLKLLNLRKNHIRALDDSILLAPSLETLNLNLNSLEEISNLDKMTNLTTLHLAANQLTSLEGFSGTLPNLLYLNLCQNRIISLKGLEGLMSLRGLDVTFNLIESIEEVARISHLPNLDFMVLTGNPVSRSVDYRIKVIECFGNRAASLFLDNEQTTQKELDTVSVLQALKIVKEGRTPHFPDYVVPLKRP